jgi:hypothetical protein
MRFSRQKQVVFSRDLPEDIQSALLRHTVQVEFEHNYLRGDLRDRTEPTFDQLVTWCESHSSQLFSAAKWASHAAHFRFWLESDLQLFESYLAESVAHAADSAT